MVLNGNARLWWTWTRDYFRGLRLIFIQTRPWQWSETWSTRIRDYAVVHIHYLLIRLLPPGYHQTEQFEALPGDVVVVDMENVEVPNGAEEESVFTDGVTLHAQQQLTSHHYRSLMERRMSLIGMLTNTDHDEPICPG